MLYRTIKRWPEQEDSLWDRHYVLSGPKGAITLGISRPMPTDSRILTDIGYHSPVPHSYGTHMNECPFMEGECWYDGSSLAGQTMWEEYEANGDLDGLWERLEDWYHGTFDQEIEDDTVEGLSQVQGGSVPE